VSVSCLSAGLVGGGGVCVVERSEHADCNREINVRGTEYSYGLY
jgi:hypothetical protein